MSSRKQFAIGARACVTAGLALALVAAPLAGCSSAGTAAASGSSETSATADTAALTSTSTDTATMLLDASDVFSDRDWDASYDASEATTISLSDAGSTVSGSGATADGSVVTITEAGTYVISGSLSDGQVVVDAADDAKVQVVLAGASVTSSSSAAVYVKAADKVFLTLAEGTENTLATSGSFTDTGDGNNVDGTVFSKADLTVNGSGTLAVASAQGHGIVCKDDLAICGGTIDVTAAGHAIQGKDSVAVGAGELTLSAGTDAIHCANDEDAEKGWVYVSGGTITATAASDGIDAGLFLEVDGGAVDVSAADDGLHAEYGLVINGGTITVSQSNEALEGSYVTITGGSIDVTASDDGINAAGDPTDSTSTDSSATTGGMGAMGGGMDEYDSTAQVTISGGTVSVNASGDGIDSNGDLSITGGEVYVSGPTNDGNGALDYAGSGSISGGTIIAVGSTGMAQSLDAAGSQGVMLVSVSGSAGDTIEVLDQAGNVLCSTVAAKQFSCAVISCSGLDSDGTYTVRAGTSETSVTLSGGSYSDVSGGMDRMTTPGDQGGAAPGGQGGMQGGTPPTGSAPNGASR
ncbi:MAG: carbohydrate-binding domain-containing protein [Olsenella sp.]|nr:carbohydrate-binding domain-containing protein [Olsenella sp.]